MCSLFEKDFIWRKRDTDYYSAVLLYIILQIALVNDLSSSPQQSKNHRSSKYNPGFDSSPVTM